MCYDRITWADPIPKYTDIDLSADERISLCCERIGFYDAVNTHIFVGMRSHYDRTEFALSSSSFVYTDIDDRMSQHMSHYPIILVDVSSVRTQIYGFTSMLEWAHQPRMVQIRSHDVKYTHTFQGMSIHHDRTRLNPSSCVTMYMNVHDPITKRMSQWCAG
jgi:hypothetical protein